MEESSEELRFLKEFRIPDYILSSEATSEAVEVEPQCPVLVFINSKSGGQLGGDLLVTYRSLLNAHQVTYVFLVI